MNKHYYYLRKKKVLYLWDEAMNISKVFNKLWDRAYLEHYPDGGQDLEYAPSNWLIEYFRGEAILPLVKMRKTASPSFINKVKEYINTNGEKKDYYALY